MIAEIVSDNKELLGVIAAPTVAVIGTVVVAWLRLDRRNSSQHEQSYGLLQSIDGRLDNHSLALGRLEERAKTNTEAIEELNGRVDGLEESQRGDGR